MSNTNEIQIDNFHKNRSDLYKNKINYNSNSLDKDHILKLRTKNRLLLIVKNREIKDQTNKLILIEMERKRQKSERLQMSNEEN